MSILNRPGDGLFNMVIVLFRTLLHEGAMSREKLVALVAPNSVNKEAAMARLSLKTWEQLGLFIADDDGVVQIAPDLSLPRLKEKAEIQLPATMRQLVLDVQNNERFWDATENHAADLTRALSWILAQDVYVTNFVSHGDVEPVEISQLIDQSKRFIQNDTRWSGFKSWAVFLGFGSLGRYPKSDVFVIDPTIAMRGCLAAVFGNKSKLLISEFVDRLAAELPVLDRGTYRREVEAQLNPAQWVAPQSTQLSTSLSRALLRLHDAEDLRLEDHSDSPARLELLGRGSRVVRAVTHVLAKGVAS